MVIVAVDPREDHELDRYRDLHRSLVRDRCGTEGVDDGFGIRAPQCLLRCNHRRALVHRGHARRDDGPPAISLSGLEREAEAPRGVADTEISTDGQRRTDGGSDHR